MEEKEDEEGEPLEGRDEEEERSRLIFKQKVKQANINIQREVVCSTVVIKQVGRKSKLNWGTHNYPK